MFSKLLLYLSKTDTKLLKHCTEAAHNTQKSLGLTVLFTGILAILSGSFAIATIFYEFDAVTKSINISTNALLISLAIGLLYGLMIMHFDREIVSASNRMAALTRLPLAFMIGIVIALPLELKILEDRINKQLFVNQNAENETFRQERDVKLEALNTKTLSLETNLRTEQEAVSEWSAVMEAEAVGRSISGRTGLKGRGPAYDEALENRTLHEGYLTNIQEQLTAHLTYAQDQRGIIIEEFEGRYVEQQYDLLSMVEALEEVQTQSPAAFYLSWGLRLFLILIEIFPALVKLFLPHSEYDALMEARRRLNHQIAHTIANQGLQDMNESIENAYNPHYMERIKTSIMK